MDGQMGGWIDLMDGQMGGQIDLMDGQMGGQIIGQVDEWTDNRTSRQMDRYQDKSMDGQIIGQVNEWIGFTVPQHNNVIQHQKYQKQYMYNTF